MKKIFVISGLMMAAIVALSGCQVKEQAEVVPGRVFTVAASTDNGTKTTNNGMQTLWADKDAISVFYNDVTGGYSAATKMTLSDGAGTKNGVFTADGFEAPSGNHDWYAIYPSGAKSPASVDSNGGYTYVGDTRGLTQQGYDDTSILCGTACPMYGVAKDVSGSPVFAMKQLATVIEFNIVNKTDAPVKINKVTLDESESDIPIVGSFYIDFTGEKPAYVKSGDNFVSTKAFTSVASPADLAVDATAKVYMPLVPFAHDPSNYFYVLVEGEINGTAFTSTVCLKPAEHQCLFEAGKIKKVNVPLEELEAVNSNSVADVVNGTVGDSYLVKDALVTMVYNKGFFATDGNETILVYMNATPSVAKGDKVDINGITSTYSNMVQFKQPTVTIKSSGNPVSLPEPVAYTGTEVDAAAATGTNAYVSVTATATSATAATVEGATATLALNASSDLDVTITSGKTYNLTGYVYGYYGGKVYLYVDSAEDAGGDTPGPGPTTNTIAEALAGTIGTSYSISEATIVSVVGVRLFVSDGTGTILVYNKNNTLEKGQKISISGATKTYNNLPYFENPTIDILEGTESVSLTPVVWTDSQLKEAYGSGNEKIQYISCDITLSTASNGIIPDSNVVLYISKATGVSTSKDKRYTLTGFLYGWTDYKNNDTVTPEVCMFVEKAELAGSGASEPVLKLNGGNSATVTFDAVPAGTQEVKVTCDNNGWTVTGAPDWVSVNEDKEASKILVSVSENTGELRSATLSVNHSNGEIVCTLTVTQAAKPSGDSGSNTAVLTNAHIVAAGEASNGYSEWTVKDANDNEYHAFAIKNYHSKATNAYHYLQIKKYKDDVASYIQIPAFGTKIKTIKMTVSNSSKPMDGGGNTATLFFSSSNSTSAAGDGVASGVGAASVTIDVSSLNLNTGYITTSAAVRIWDIEISYD